jgi:hypothetical protein
MSADGDYPLLEDTPDGLGVRVPIDIRPDDNGRVKPANAKKVKGDGMSVTPGAPRRMHPKRCPRWLGGENDLPLWRIDELVLSLEVRFRRDRMSSPTHGVIEPAHEMTLGEFRAAIAATRTSWVLVPEGSL